MPERRLFSLLLAGLVALVPLEGGRAEPPFPIGSAVSILPEWPGGRNVAPSVRKARRERPEGSGVAILPGGYIATNLHVLREATAIRVRLHDGRILAAKRIGIDPPTDLALIKIAVDLAVPATAVVPPLATPVCAIGNPFGLGLSVSCGVVSARHRTGVGFNPIEDFIQTDAAINPGASGGPLFDAKGRLVGLVSAILNKQVDANIGVNFATSIALVRRVVTDLKEHGRVRRGRMGWRVRTLPEEERTRLVGARVIRVSPDGAAAKAGIEVGDIITEIAGRAIAKASDVTSAVQLHRPGDEIRIVLDRAGVASTRNARLSPSRR